MLGSPVVERVPVCAHGKEQFLSSELIASLVALEDVLGFELHFHSGYRCALCNKAAGGVPNSGHLRGVAVDVSGPDSATRFRIVQAALKVGFRRVGIGKNFIHLDLDSSLPQNMMWLYL